MRVKEKKSGKSTKNLQFILLFLLTFVSFIAIASAATLNNSSYSITIDPIGNHTQGDVFFINGSTDLPASETLFIEARPVSIPFSSPPTEANNPIRMRGISGIVAIKPGMKNINSWSFNATDGKWAQGEYWVNAHSINRTSGMSASNRYTSYMTILPLTQQIWTMTVAVVPVTGNSSPDRSGPTPVTTHQSLLPFEISLGAFVLIICGKFQKQ